MVFSKQPGGQQEQAEAEIDLLALLKVVWQHKWLVIVAAIVFAVAGFFYTKILIEPTYRSSFTAFVNNRREGTADDVNAISSGDTNAAQSLTYTYAEIIKSAPILEEAAQKIGLEENLGSLRSYVSTSIGDRTQLVYVYVTMNSPQIAQAYAEAIASIAPNHLEEIVEGTSMKIVADPKVPTAKFSPSTKKNVLIAMLLGIVVAVAFIVIRELLDTRVKDQKELSDYFGVPVIGTIPNFEHATASSYGGKYGYGYGQKQKSSAKKGEK